MLVFWTYFYQQKVDMFSIYRPSESSNLSTFFEELTTSLSKEILKYENLLIMGDFNIDMKSKCFTYNKLDEFCDLLNLTKLIKSETCFTKNHKSLIDFILTNTTMSFQRTHVSETGLSDYHKLITTFLKANFSCPRLKVLSYRNCKNFYESKFLNDLNKTIITFDNENPNQNYNVLSTKRISLISDSEKLFITEPSWKKKYTKILRKKTKSHIKSKYIFV